MATHLEQWTLLLQLWLRPEYLFIPLAFEVPPESPTSFQLRPFQWPPTNHEVLECQVRRGAALAPVLAEVWNLRHPVATRSSEGRVEATACRRFARSGQRGRGGERADGERRQRAARHGAEESSWAGGEGGHGVEGIDSEQWMERRVMSWGFRDLGRFRNWIWKDVDWPGSWIHFYAFDINSSIMNNNEELTQIPVCLHGSIDPGLRDMMRNIIK